MRSDFDESYRSPDQDPLDAASHEFPWAEVFERLDSGRGLAAGEPETSEAITKLMHLLLANTQDQRINPQVVGLRLIALGWVLSPSNYPGTPSLRELAERCGVSPAALAYHTGNVSRSTGIRNRAQAHASNWKPPERSALDDGSLLEDRKENDPA